MPPDNPRPDLTFELREVSKFFGDLVALKRIDLRIEPCDSVLLYGPNGAGKTTLLRLMAGLSRPNEGQIWFGGQDLSRNPARARAAIGFASHATFLYGELTAFENLRFHGALFGLRDLDTSIQTVLDRFGLRDRAAVPVRDLSRGLQQRVALARAFLHDPQVALLDEPFTGLDAQAAKNLETLLKALPAARKALVFSSHHFAQGATIARRLVALEAGRIRFDGPLSQAPLEALGISPQAGSIPAP